MGILSGGFTYFARKLQKEMGIDYVHANELDFKDGRLTGEVRAPLLLPPSICMLYVSYVLFMFCFHLYLHFDND